MIKLSFGTFINCLFIMLITVINSVNQCIIIKCYHTYQHILGPFHSSKVWLHCDK